MQWPRFWGSLYKTVMPYRTKAITIIYNEPMNFLSSNISSTCPHNTVNYGPLAAEIISLVSGTPGNFNGFRVLAALLHGTLVVGVSQTLRWTEGATHIRQGGHHVGHWPTFLVVDSFTLWENLVLTMKYKNFRMLVNFTAVVLFSRTYITLRNPTHGNHYR